ncbi:MAG: acylphosphatase [Chloroflexota bacterium]|nr:acylphosphatase [Chloroflexota bacterium]
MPRLAATVYGRVQGVAFRYFVQIQARRLGVSGYARNRADGYSVEVCAEGGQADLDTLLAQLRIGPPGARVVRVDAEWPSATGEFTGFTIRT